MSSDLSGDSVPEPEPIITATVVHRAESAAPRSNTKLPGRTHPQPPTRWAEVLAAVTLVVLADVTIYRGEGFAGFSALFAVGAGLLWLGAYRPRLSRDFWLLGSLLTLLSARILWQGSWLAVVIGFALLLSFAMTLTGQRPYVLSVVTFIAQVIRGGFDGLLFYAARLAGHRVGKPVPWWLSIVLPAGALVLFAAIFTAANPDVLTLVSDTAQQWALAAQQWLTHFSYLELLFWLFVLWLSTGLLRPTPDSAASHADLNEAAKPHVVSEPAPLYSAFRNTLLAVIGLFAAYLVFEFKTLWFRQFPSKFYYAGYAHQGAAWLTLALALATAILSLIFSGRMLRDPRLAMLRRLAWVWSLLNFLLAIAVYHRLLIYIGFNGLTRMRIVGLLGITAVVIGFLLVLWKINRDRSFAWLVRRQMWTVALMVYLYAVLPIDALTVRYNVARIMAGDPKPAVQLVVHPISAEGMLQLDPLLTCSDPIIRDGVQAMLAAADREAQGTVSRQRRLGWTAYQMADNLLAQRLKAQRSAWANDTDREKQAGAIVRFSNYVYQWY
ncbi:MAG: DUF4173 domain-containing protein [Planctomycetes bacterium]|nr:DUF4173 domain-containing protein [Planctomycetota bacterium]